MRKIFILVATLLSVSAFAQVKVSDDGFQANVRGVEVKVEFYTPEIVRVFKTVESSNLDNKQNFVVTLDPQHPQIKINQADGIVSAQSSALQVTFDTKTGKVEFKDLNGNILLSEKEYGVRFTPVQFMGRFRMPATPPPTTQFTQSSPGQDTPGMPRMGMRMNVESTNEVIQSFVLDEDEVIYGLGQHQKGLMNQRNQRLRLEQQNMEIAIPYFSSVKGYGVYWDTYSITTFDDTPMGASFTSEAAEAVDYYFLYGKDGDGNVARFRELTGKANLAPLWTFGFWQCKERYKSADEVMEVGRKYRELGVPLDAVIQDWKYWGEEENTWNALSFGNPAFSNSDEMFKTVKDLNLKMMITIWPSVGEVTDIYKDLDAIGALFPMQTSPKVAKVYNVWDPKASDIFWSYMKKNLFDKGMSAWWLDGPEPEFYNTQASDFNASTPYGALRNIRNTYPLFVSKNVYEHQRAETSDKRVYILTRSAFAGLQRYGAGSWSGDVRASWDVFAKQISAGLNFSMCAIPYWNTDIGAWHPFGDCYNDANTNPGYQEFYCRWFQFGAFTPMMRAHGTGSPREIYQFGERGYWAFDVQEKFLNLRYSILPYLYSTAWQVTDKNYSFIRHMSMEAPKDEKTYNLADQYMFGSAFLVAPILKAGEGEDRTSTRDVYLPNSSDWFDFWTNEKFNGGQTVIKAAPIDIMPLYVKAGSIIPFTTEKVQYSTEKKWTKLELRVYPGADASFVLYEDEFDNYNYEGGAYTEIPVSWDEASRTLTVGNRNGAYNGMLKSRKFVVSVAGENVSKTINYSGKQVNVKL